MFVSKFCNLCIALTFFVLPISSRAQDFAFEGSSPNIPGYLSNRGVTAASPSGPNFPIWGYLNSTISRANGLQANLLQSFNAVDVATGDVNADGFQDILAVSSDPVLDGNRLVILFGEGDGTFSFPNVFNLGSLAPLSIDAADTNTSDGVTVVDAVIGGNCNNQPGCSDVIFISHLAIQALTGGTLTPNGTTVQGINFHSIGVPSNEVPVSVVMGRLNDDAFADIATAWSGGNGQSGSVAISLFNGSSFPPTNAFPLTGTVQNPAPRSLFIAPTNVLNDADPDIVVATSAGAELFENNGSGGFGPAQPGNGTVAAGTGPVGVVLADINADSRNDIIVLNKGSGNISSFVANAAGGYNSPSTISFSGFFNVTNPISMDLINLNNDGRPDLIVTSLGNGGASTPKVIAVLGSSVSPFFSGQQSFSPVVPIFNPQSVAVGKFDTVHPSANSDFVVVDGTSASNTGGIAYFDAANPISPFLPIYQEVFSAVSLAADFDGGGNANDIAILEQHFGVVIILLNIGTSPVESGSVFAQAFTGFNPAVFTSAVPLKDAHSTLMHLALTDITTPTSSSGTGKIIVAQNDGTGQIGVTINQYSEFPASPGATNLMTGDFNNDGFQDLAFIDFITNQAAISLNDGNNNFPNPVFTDTGGFIPVSARVADVNDDDNLDLVVAHQGAALNVNSNQSVVSVLLGDGTGHLQPTGQLLQVPNFALSLVGGVANFETNNIPRIVDFNNDGFPDFAVASTRGAVNSLGIDTPTVSLILNRADSPGNFVVQPAIPLIDDTTPGNPNLQLEGVFGGPGLVSGLETSGPPRTGPGGNGAGIGAGGANYTLAVGDFNADGSPDLTVTGTFVNEIFPGTNIPRNFRAAIYLTGNETAGTMRVSRPMRAATLGQYLSSITTPSTIDIFNAGDTFVASATGEFNPLSNKVPDLMHISLNGNIFVDSNTTSVLNHAPIVTINRADLNAPNGSGRKSIVGGQMLTIPVSAQDVDNDSLTFNLVQTPSGQSVPSFVKLTNNGNNTATITINPAEVTGPGTFRIAVEASDSPSANSGGRLPLIGRDYFTIVANPSCPPSVFLTGPQVSSVLSCDDSDPCTNDSCVDGQGCVFNSLIKYPGAVCTCQRAVPVSCKGDKLTKTVLKAFTKACKGIPKGDPSPSVLKKKKQKIKDTLTSLKESSKALKKNKKKISAACVSDLTNFLADAMKRFKAR